MADSRLVLPQPFNFRKLHSIIGQACMHVHVHVSMCTYMYMYMNMNSSTQTSMYIYAHVHLHTSTVHGVPSDNAEEVVFH